MCTFICKRGELINYTRCITAIISSCPLKVIMYAQGHQVRSRSKDCKFKKSLGARSNDNNKIVEI